VVAVHDTLDQLDEALVAARRALQRPGYRRRVLGVLDRPLELATLRTLRAVERLGDGRTCVGEVADLLGVDPSTASRTVERCVEASLLVRTPGETDRRRSDLGLTDAGRDVLRAVTTARREVLDEATEGWDPVELARLTQLLQALLAGFDRVEQGS
jgi:DNA-binding MarR family transcriptional regulator